MIKFEFNAEAYKAAVTRTLIPEGQYRARVKAIDVKNQADGTVIINLTLVTTWKNTEFIQSVFLNPPTHPFYSSSNRRFGDLCISCEVNPSNVLQDEKVLEGKTCGIELEHRKGEFNSVKKWLRPNETEFLKDFGAAPENFTANDNTPEAFDPNDPSKWF